jgi:Rho termination factor, N-terminal domain
MANDDNGGDFEQVPNDAEGREEGQPFDQEAHDKAGGVILTAPSQSFNPSLSTEEQNMEMTPKVIGPPAYGSPDPYTVTAKLVPIEEHALAAENAPEGARISEDYGKDVEGATLAAGEMTHPGGPQRSDLDRDAAGLGPLSAQGDYEEMTTNELRDLAKQRGLSGYSGLTKDEMIELHEEYDAGQSEEETS